MEIYNFYSTLIYMNLVKNGITGISKQSIFGSLTIAVLIWLAFFLLQGVGLWTMAKKRNEKKQWLAFVPFVNLLLIDKLAGDVEIFGHKMKRPGMYAMIAEICAVVVACGLGVCEGLLFTRYAQSIDYNASNMTIVWTNLDATGKALYDFYNMWGDLLYSIFALAYEVLLFVLMISLLKRYAAKNYMTLSLLQLVVPISRFVIIFVVRKNKAINYEEYRRAKQEEYIRRATNYGNPYNPYGNPYGNARNNPYGNPYGNPYANPNDRPNASQNGGQGENPFGEFSNGSKEVDPFEDIMDYSARNVSSSNTGDTATNESETTKNSESSNDDFF